MNVVLPVEYCPTSSTMGLLWKSAGSRAGEWKSWKSLATICDLWARTECSGMKKKGRRAQDALSGAGETLLQRCVLCRRGEDDAALYGDKLPLREDGLCVHYLCLLTSCGVYQRGRDGQGVLGFLVADIKREIRRSARLTCCACRKKGACVGCNVKSCRKKVHFPCGRRSGFVSQFTQNFPSYCPEHGPAQSRCAGSDPSPPPSCSVCLDAIDDRLSYGVLKCPSCHASWFHRDCVQRQAHSAGLYFFRCPLCNNKEQYQQEMLRMGIYIPERDASWELEADAYADLLEVYMRCDAHTCVWARGRAHSAKAGWFQVIRCRMCGSRGTHRKCSGLEADAADWACPECVKSTDGKGLSREGARTLQQAGDVLRGRAGPLPSADVPRRASDEAPSARTLAALFAARPSRDGEAAAAAFWERFLLDSQAGHSSISPQDLLVFATGSASLPAGGLAPTPSVSFLHPGGGDEDEDEEARREEGLFPQRRPEENRLVLPVTSSYRAFKRAMEQAVSHYVYLHANVHKS